MYRFVSENWKSYAQSPENWTKGCGLGVGSVIG